MKKGTDRIVSALRLVACAIVGLQLVTGFGIYLDECARIEEAQRQTSEVKATLDEGCTLSTERVEGLNRYYILRCR